MFTRKFSQAAQLLTRAADEIQDKMMLTMHFYLPVKHFCLAVCSTIDGLPFFRGQIKAQRRTQMQ